MQNRPFNGKRLRELRLRAGKNTAEFAHLAGYSRFYVNNVERNADTPGEGFMFRSVEVLTKLLEREISIEDLCDPLVGEAA